MNTVFNKLSLKMIGVGMLLSLALNPQPQASASPIYFDDFEQYKSDADIKKAYTVWDDGAVLNVSLNKTALDPSVHSLRLNFGQPNASDKSIRIDVTATGQINQAMKIELIAPNSANRSVNGSIYHVLPGRWRAWTGGSAVRFRVDNASTETLLLSFNFKEEFNEYWAVSTDGIFFLQSSENLLVQKDIEYGNLPIPANFQGFVLIPFYSFSVPAWNTARGDEVMNLKRIESFAFSVQLGHALPRAFVVDDVEVIPEVELKTLTIQGASRIQVPVSGEHREQFTTVLHAPSKDDTKQVKADWSLVQSFDSNISIGDDGILTVPSGTQSGTIIISATHSVGEYAIADEFLVEIVGQEPAPQQPDALLDEIEQTNTAYEEFSRGFELWAVEYRPLFVAVSIGVILLVLALLSRFQRRLK